MAGRLMATNKLTDIKNMKQVMVIVYLYKLKKWHKKFDGLDI